MKPSGPHYEDTTYYLTLLHVDLALVARSKVRERSSPRAPRLRGQLSSAVLAHTTSDRMVPHVVAHAASRLPNHINFNAGQTVTNESQDTREDITPKQKSLGKKSLFKKVTKFLLEGWVMIKGALVQSETDLARYVPNS